MPEIELMLANGGQRVPLLLLLVTFGDVREPWSVDQVDPAVFERTFGNGVTQRRIPANSSSSRSTKGCSASWAGPTTIMKSWSRVWHLCATLN